MDGPDPWAFGWNQLLTILGLAITTAIAISGFRTFRRWRREQLEERRIEIAFEALSIAYEAKFVFDSIRSPMAYAHEWADMPRVEGETENQWNSRGSYYAILKRIGRQKDYFERLWKLQPQFMAAFGPQTEQVFLHLHEARRFVEVSAQMLARQRHSEPGPGMTTNQRQREQWEADIWVGMDEVSPGLDRVNKRLVDFKTEIERLCLPVTQQSYARR